jgi:hypothetical protein
MTPTVLALGAVGAVLALIVSLVLYMRSAPAPPASSPPPPSSSKSRTGGGPYSPSERASRNNGPAPLPLEDVRYGSYLEMEGVTTQGDLEALEELTAVNRVGTEYGQIIATDLRNAGVPEETIPPVAKTG